MTELALIGKNNQITLPVGASEAVGAEPGGAVVIRQTGPDTLEVKVLPRLTLAEMIERYRIDEPIDRKKLQEEIEEAIAEDALKELRRA